MAAPASTFLSYSAKGNREDLSDIIYNVDPTDTPFITGIDRVSATAVLHEWQTDSLAAASTGNAVLEGDDATTDSVTATTRLSNSCQIQDKVARVSRTQNSVLKAGRRNELAYQIVKKTKELRRDMETTALQNQAEATGDATTARTMGALLAWVNTNTSKSGTSAADGSLGNTKRTDGIKRAFTETLLKSVLRDCWDNGGDPDCIMVGSFNKNAMSSFTGGATKFKDVEDRTLVAAVDYYESDWGVLEVVPNRFMRSRDALILQKDMWAAAYLDPVQVTDLAKTGDSERRQIIVEWTLEARNEKSSGGVFDLTTS